MARYQVILAYDGAAYQGFQRQRNAPTIQGSVEAILQKLGWKGKSLLAAGRTDSGVHAAGQVIAFDLDWRHSPEALQSAMNARLPADITARSVQLAADDFHPRYDALSRRYRYRVYPGRERHALLDRYAWRVWPAPELELLKAAGLIFLGEHDFAAFGTPPIAGGTTIRKIHSAEWLLTRDPLSEQDLLVFEVSANAFLYHMVRRLTFQVIKVGQGQGSLEKLLGLLEEPPEIPIQGLAPSNGLVLAGVSYPGSDDENKLVE